MSELFKDQFKADWTPEVEKELLQKIVANREARNTPALKFELEDILAALAYASEGRTNSVKPDLLGNFLNRRLAAARNVAPSERDLERTIHDVLAAWIPDRYTRELEERLVDRIGTLCRAANPVPIAPTADLSEQDCDDFADICSEVGIETPDGTCIGSVRKLADAYAEMCADAENLQSQVEQCEKLAERWEWAANVGQPTSGEVKAQQTGWKQCAAELRAALRAEQPGKVSEP